MPNAPDSRATARLTRSATVAVFAIAASIASAVHAGSVDILASGLANPRGIALGPAGLVLVVEAGTGVHRRR